MGKRAIRVLLAMFVMLSICWGTDIGSGGFLPGGRRPAYAPGELLVKYKPALRKAAAEYLRQRWGVSTLRTFHDIGVHHVKLPADLAVEEALDLYRNDPDVEYAEPNYYRYVTAIPNDTNFGLLWGLSTISAPEAWDLRTDCAEAVVAVIDSGVDFRHPDIAANVWSNPGEVAGDGIDNDVNGYVDDVMGWDFVDGDALPMDSNSHGTHVAGTIAAVGDNARGVAGVCWTGKLMILRAFDAVGVAKSSDVIAAMAYARSNGARVINASYGSSPGDPPSQAEQDELSLCNTAGILFVAAAGNEANNNDSQRVFPASYDIPNIIAVAATSQDDSLAGFSNYGQNSVHVAAPGTNIYSTKPGRQTIFSDNFDDGNISDWTVEAPWGVSTTYAASGSYSLADSPTGNYANSINVSARPTNPINLSGQTGAVLTFKLKGTILGGDALYVETALDPAATWTSLLGLFGDSQGEWVDLVVDLGNLDGTASYFRFRLQTDGSGTADGVYIDDVEVTASAVQDTYQFLQGTSMATPHVTGLSALVWAHTPALTHLQVKERVLNSVDRLPALSTTTSVFTQGRINASNSIRNLPAPPVGLSATAASSSQINLTWANTYYGQIGFKIERKEGASGSFAEIANLSTNTTSYNDTGLTSSTAYTYRVRAYTSANDSVYSSEVTATTPAPPSGGGGGGGGGCFIDTVLGK